MKVLITGAGGMLAHAFAAAAAECAHDAVLADRKTLDVTSAEAVEEFIGAAQPEVVLHCAAYTRVDDAESEEAIAFAINAEGAANVARAAARAGAWVVYPSTDYVFDGSADTPYTPGAATAPLNAYGRSKLAGERATASLAPRHLVVRTSWLYGARGRNFVSTILQRARNGAPLRIVRDQRGSPTWTQDLAGAVFRLLGAGAPAGTYHVCNRGETTWYDLACAALRCAGIDAQVTPVSTTEYVTPAQRPAYSVLDCAKTDALIGPQRSWESALAAALGAGL